MANWEDTALGKFLDAAYHNQKVHAAKFPAAFTVLEEINQCFDVGGKHLINLKVPLTGSLFLRSQYAYKAAAGMALSGQVVEAFQATRLCMEMAGYCLVISQNPELLEVFISRHVSDEAMKAQKKAFKISEVEGAIAKVDGKLLEIFEELYDRSIDFGGHPNPNALFSAMEMTQENGTTHLVTHAFTLNDKSLLHAVKGVAQGGMTALHIIQHIFTAKFELLGLRARLAALRGAQLGPGIGL